MRQRILATLAALIVGTAALAADVQTDYDTQRNFSTFNHYAWQDHGENIDKSFANLDAEAIKTLLSERLDSLAAPAGDKSPADFLVRCYIRPFKKLVDDRPRLGVGVGGFNDNVGGGVSFSFPLGGSDLDQPAQVVVDFLDPKTEKLVWRGSLKTSLSSKSTKANQKQLQKAFDEILKRFPPR